jgi:hypothetical protein
MTEAEQDSDEDYDEQWPTLAIPPLYLLQTAERCPECGNAMHVYTLGSAAFRHADDSRPVEVFHFLRVIRSLPKDVLKLLQTKCPNYFLDREDGSYPKPYMINHCRCGAKLDDHFLHGDVGAAFQPGTPEGYAQIKLFLLPVDDAIPVDSLYAIGGDEFMDFDETELW